MSLKSGITSLFLLILAVLAIYASFRVETDFIEGGGRSLEGFALFVVGLAFLPFLWRQRLSWAGAALSAHFILSMAAWAAFTKPTWLFFFRARLFELKDRSIQIALFVLLTQVLVVAWQLRRHRPELRVLLRQFRLRFVLVLGLALLCTGSHLTLLYPLRDELRYWILQGVQYCGVAALVLVSLAHLILIALKLPVTTRAEEPRPEDTDPGLVPGFLGRHLALISGLWVFAVAAATSYFVLDRIPHVPDGFAYLFQAKTIAQGAFASPAPQVPEAFRLYLIDVSDGQWFAVTNPGYPMLLAIGVKLGLPWLVNPILGGLGTAFSHGLFRRLLDRRRADMAVLILALSPWMLFLSASFMTHVATHLFAVLGFIAALDASRERRSDKAFLSGACFGFICLIRPLDGVLLGVVAGLHLLVQVLKRASSWRVLATFSVGAILLCSVLLIFARALPGDSFDAPINAYIADLWPESTNRLGFGPEVGNPPQTWGILDPIPGHGWRDVLLNTNQNLANLQMEFLGWPIGSLFLILFLLGQKKMGAGAHRAFLILGLLLVGYNLYWFSGGPDFGPRYWFSMLLPLVYLTVLAIDRLVGLGTTPETRGRIRSGLILTFLLAAPVFFAWRVTGRYLDYRGFHGGYRDLIEENDLRGTLIFVDTPEEVDYGCAFMENDPFLGPDTAVFARDLGKEANFRLMRAMRSRRILYLQGPGKGPGEPRFVNKHDR